MAEKKKVLYIVEAMGGGVFTYIVDGVQFVQALLEANGLAAGKDYQFKGRYEAEKNAVIISLEKDEREW